MSTHIDAQAGDIAPNVLLPGDPLRAKYIAENFLEDVVLYNNVRNAFGYTGKYKGQMISVQASGMGIPSIAIYTNELIKDYGAKRLIRVGSCGAMSPNINIRDILVAQAASTDSSFIKNIFGRDIYYAPTANFDLLLKTIQQAQKINLALKVGNIFSADMFYNDELDIKKLAEYNILASEMEAAVLYTLAAKYDVEALAILTVSDHMLTGEKTTAEERATSFNDMIKLSLETAIS